MAEKSKVPSNVANPSLYRKARAKAKAKFDVFPSAVVSNIFVFFTISIYGYAYPSAFKLIP